MAVYYGRLFIVLTTLVVLSEMAAIPRKSVPSSRTRILDEITDLVEEKGIHTWCSGDRWDHRCKMMCETR